MSKEIRVFDTGANRDISTGKLEYSSYIHPLSDYSFAEYMKSKQIIGGEYRRGDNRQKGIPYDSLFESLIRHTEILKLLYKGYKVIEYKQDGEVKLDVSLDDKLTPNDATDVQIKTIESELNAIRFNSEAMKLQYISKDFLL